MVMEIMPVNNIWFSLSYKWCVAQFFLDMRTT